MVIYFTPDEWPCVRAALRRSGIEQYQRLRLDLRNPDAGWQPVAPQPYRAAVELPLDPVVAASATQN